jgi:hypothetical protein
MPEISVPDHVHPFVQFIFREMHEELRKIAGVGDGTVSNWRRTNTPTIHNLEAILNVLGWRLEPVKVGKRDV